MKTAIALLLSFTAVACAQDRKQDDKKRLSSVTWDLKSHKLAWDVQHGSVVNGEFVASSSDHYEISPDDAVMTVSQERRGFTEAEAASLHKLLDTLSLYCAESVVWWDQGQGIKLDDKSKPRERRHEQDRPDRTDPNRQKVDEPQPGKKPTPIQQSDLVAVINMIYGARDAQPAGGQLAAQLPK